MAEILHNISSKDLIRRVNNQMLRAYEFSFARGERDFDPNEQQSYNSQIGWINRLDKLHQRRFGRLATGILIDEIVGIEEQTVSEGGNN